MFCKHIQNISWYNHYTQYSFLNIKTSTLGRIRDCSNKVIFTLFSFLTSCCAITLHFTEQFTRNWRPAEQSQTTGCVSLTHPLKPPFCLVNPEGNQSTYTPAALIFISYFHVVLSFIPALTIFLSLVVRLLHWLIDACVLFLKCKLLWIKSSPRWVTVNPSIVANK